MVMGCFLDEVDGIVVLLKTKVVGSISRPI